MLCTLIKIFFFYTKCCRSALFEIVHLHFKTSGQCRFNRNFHIQCHFISFILHKINNWLSRFLHNLNQIYVSLVININILVLIFTKIALIFLPIEIKFDLYFFLLYVHGVYSPFQFSSCIYIPWLIKMVD